MAGSRITIQGDSNTVSIRITIIRTHIIIITITTTSLGGPWVILIISSRSSNRTTRIRRLISCIRTPTTTLWRPEWPITADTLAAEATIRDSWLHLLTIPRLVSFTIIPASIWAEEVQQGEMELHLLLI
jgi:hypothetical protein